MEICYTRSETLTYSVMSWTFTRPGLYDSGWAQEARKKNGRPGGTQIQCPLGPTAQSRPSRIPGQNPAHQGLASWKSALNLSRGSQDVRTGRLPRAVTVAWRKERPREKGPHSEWARSPKGQPGTLSPWLHPVVSLSSFLELSYNPGSVFYPHTCPPGALESGAPQPVGAPAAGPSLLRGPCELNNPHSCTWPPQP